MRKKTTSGARSTKGNDKDCAQPSSTIMTMFLSLVWIDVALCIACPLSSVISRHDYTAYFMPLMLTLLAVAITYRKNWARISYVIFKCFHIFVCVVSLTEDGSLDSQFMVASLIVSVICVFLCFSKDVSSAFVSCKNVDGGGTTANILQCALFWGLAIVLLITGLIYDVGLMDDDADGSDGASESSQTDDDGNDSELEEKLRMLFGSDDDDDAEEGETEYNAKIHPPIIAIPSYRRDENLNRRISFEVANMDTGKSILVRAKAVGHDVTREIVIPPGGKETIDNLKWIGSHEMEDVVFILSVPGYEYVLVIRYKTGTDRYTSRYEKRKSI